MVEKVELIDVSKCIGCRSCQIACKQWNELPAMFYDEQRHLSESTRPSGKYLDAGPLPGSIRQKRDGKMVVPERRVHALHRCHLCEFLPGRREISFGVGS